MNVNEDKINQLQARYEMLANKQKAFINELLALGKEIDQLKGEDFSIPKESRAQITEEPELVSPVSTVKTPIYDNTPKKLSRDIDNKIIGGVCAGLARDLNMDKLLVRILWLVLTFLSYGIGIAVYLVLWIAMGTGKVHQQANQQQAALQRERVKLGDKMPSVSKNLEKFVGENLISIAGVVITVFGVGVGVKYSIEKDLISPIARIVLGYLAGIALLSFGIKLKKNFNNYSAVLVSGAIAILYLITYFAYAFYGLFPQVIAFAMMVVFTAFTIVAAVNYNKQIIAHIGLVGAYAVPFLLSDGSGDAVILFGYMTCINVGILVTSFWKYWKPLYYSAFGLTWTIYLTWYLLDYIASENLSIAFTFLSIFFAIFYLTILSYKLLKKEKFVTQDIILLLANSVVFYGIGYHILDNHEIGKDLLGLFTLGNALIHFIISVIIYKQKLVDKQLLYLIIGLVLVFITLAVPVQLDGNWVTLIWAGLAALLFWIGRTKHVSFYEMLSYPLMILAFFSITQDWTMIYNNYIPEQSTSRIRPLLNINFFSALLFIVAFIFIYLVNRKKSSPSKYISAESLTKIISYASVLIIIFSLYSIFQLEIANYFDQLYKDSVLSFNNEGQGFPNNFKNYDLVSFKEIWMISFSLVFVSILSLINSKKIKSKILGMVVLGLMCIIALLFLVVGLQVLGDLRQSYIEQTLSEYYQRGVFNIYIRYISILLFAIMIGIGYQYVDQKFVKLELKRAVDIFLHVSVLWILSSELIHWMHLAGNTSSDKLGLSILWGLYSLFLIVLGIFKKKKHLRIGAIVLFGIVLIKLFFYDIAHLDTIAKTIVLVSLGVLLLLISFLYNKYKSSISDESEY